MAIPKLNQPAPNFDLPCTNNKNVTLSKLKGKKVVLYFYPKDCTPGCTSEGQAFRDNYQRFNELNTIILGVSRDDVTLHEKFKTDNNFPFELISDSNETACKLYDVIKEKNLYGKKVRGIERSTFIIDDQGILRNEWRRVKIEKHVDEVLAVLKEL